MSRIDSSACSSVPGARDTLPRRQDGVSLAIVLIALVFMSLAAVGLFRTVDTSSLVIGNLAFKQGTTSSADRAAEEAIDWLKANLSAANDNDAEFGYYASSLSSLDVTGKLTTNARALADWDGDKCAYATEKSFTECFTIKAAKAPEGFKAQYLITRMCKVIGDPNDTGNSCARPVAAGNTSTQKRGEVKYGEDKRFAGTNTPYYRIVVRSVGPRNTVSFTETYVHF